MTKLRVIQGGPQRRKRKLPVDTLNVPAMAAIIVAALAVTFTVGHFAGWL